MTPSSLFLSHFLIFISFLVHNLLPGHLQLEELCLYQHPSQQQRRICISANVKCLSKLTQGYSPRGQLKCHGHDPRRAILSPWLEGELRFSVPSALSQGIKACSSWLVQLPLPAIQCMSSSASCLDWVKTPYLNTLWEQVPFKRWLLKKSPYKHTVNQLQIAFKYTFKTLHILDEFCILMSWNAASARSCLSLSKLLSGRRAVICCSPLTPTPAWSSHMDFLTEIQGLA